MSSYIFYAELIPATPIENDRAWRGRVLDGLADFNTLPVVGSSVDDPHLKTVSIDLQCDDSAGPESLLDDAVAILNRATALAGTAIASIVHIDAIHSDLLADQISDEERDAHVIDLTDVYLQRQLSA